MFLDGVFEHFQESAINFAPTYRFDINPDNPGNYSSVRVPSWTVSSFFIIDNPYTVHTFFVYFSDLRFVYIEDGVILLRLCLRFGRQWKRVYLKSLGIHRSLCLFACLVFVHQSHCLSTFLKFCYFKSLTCLKCSCSLWIFLRTVSCFEVVK